ncbi:MAG: hypothetical protein H6518_03740 [Microthrixaceae bacterium]|nr:hypothetical protein [Microthrixaceae bacterium]
MCSLSRYVVIGGFTAMAAATAAGSDVVGLLAGAVAVALTMAATRRWPGLGGSCALPPPDTGADATDDPRTAEDATVTLR